MFEISDITIHARNGFAEPIGLERFIATRSGPFFGMTGSTFATTRTPAEETAILDAAYAEEREGRYRLAVADGAGGHFGDALQDRRIASAATTAARWSHEPLDELRQRVRAVAFGEGATLTSCTIEKVDEVYRVQCLGIGDSMAVAWDPAAGETLPVVPAQVTEAGTAIFPDSFRRFEVRRVDLALPKGAILFLMTDGIHDALPHGEEEGEYENGLKFRTRHVQLESVLHGVEGESAEPFVRALVAEVVRVNEALRQAGPPEEGVIGDDATIIAIKF